MGYFRDDQPLYELILDDEQQKELDALWQEFDFVASTPMRTYMQFYVRARRQGASKARHEANAPAAESKAEEQRRHLRRRNSGNCEAKFWRRPRGSDEEGSRRSRPFPVHQRHHPLGRESRLAAEPSHLKALLDFAARAYRRPLTADENS